jgi:hypothetical protein
LFTHISNYGVIRDSLLRHTLIIPILHNGGFLTEGTVAVGDAGPWVVYGAPLVGDDVVGEEGFELDEVEELCHGVSVGDVGFGDAEGCILLGVEGDDFAGGLTSGEGEDDGFEGEVVFLEGVAFDGLAPISGVGVLLGGAAAAADEGE